jgi:hypothetical protein
MHFQGSRGGAIPPMKRREGPQVLTTAALRLGDEVIYHGRVLVLRGLEPMSVPTRRAEVEDPVTGERLVVPLAELEPVAPAESDRAT